MMVDKIEVFVKGMADPYIGEVGKDSHEINVYPHGVEFTKRRARRPADPDDFEDFDREMDTHFYFIPAHMIEGMHYYKFPGEGYKEIKTNGDYTDEK